MSKLKPLFIIVSLIILVSVLTSSSEVEFMHHFMAGFFLVFSGLKILDLKGFAHGYAKYDLLAGMFPIYGYVYAFTELTLGILYARGSVSDTVLMFTAGLMIFSALGVLNARRKNLDLRCACLGTFIDVPLTHVTLVEDLGMAGMAILMLLV